MIDVVYQYINGPSKWEELRYSIRSIEKHLKEDFRVWIVGDMPEWMKGVTHIPHKRIPGEWMTNCYDQNRKLEAVINHPEVGNDILWMYDDMYLVRDCKKQDLDCFAVINHFDKLDHGSSGVHKELLRQTLLELKKHGKSLYNCETHTPRLYSKHLLKELVELYNPTDNRFLFSTLYFNHVFSELPPRVLTKEDDYKASFFGGRDNYSFKPKTKQEIKDILSGKRFLNFNDEGLSVYLIEVIEELFPDKCCFEK